MRYLSILVLVLFQTITSTGFSYDAGAFVGKYQAKRGDCGSKTLYIIDLDTSTQSLKVSIKNGDHIIEETLSIKREPSFYLNKKTGNLEFTEVTIEDNEKSSPKTIENFTRYIEFNDQGFGQQLYFKFQALKLYDANKKLIYNEVAGDGENDPNEYICELERL